jgi:hypothetical protein
VSFFALPSVFWRLELFSGVAYLATLVFEMSECSCEWDRRRVPGAVLDELAHPAVAVVSFPPASASEVPDDKVRRVRRCSGDTPHQPKAASQRNLSSVPGRQCLNSSFACLKASASLPSIISSKSSKTNSLLQQMGRLPLLSFSHLRTILSRQLVQ